MISIQRRLEFKAGECAQKRFGATKREAVNELFYVSFDFNFLSMFVAATNVLAQYNAKIRGADCSAPPLN